MPQEIIEQLRRGGFTVSILGSPGHSVGIDEAHEMCVNKDCKEFITRSSGDYINRVARFLPVRAKALKNFAAQLFPERRSKNKSHSIHSIYTNDAREGITLFITYLTTRRQPQNKHMTS